MRSLDDSLDKPTSNLFPTGNDTISTRYGHVIRHNIIWHFAWFDWGRKFYSRMPFLTQTCWQARKLGVFTWDTISQLDSPHTSFVTQRDDNNQQVIFDNFVFYHAFHKHWPVNEKIWFLDLQKEFSCNVVF